MNAIGLALLNPLAWLPDLHTGFTTMLRKELTEWIRTGRLTIATAFTTGMLILAPIVYWAYMGGLRGGRLPGGYQTLLITWVALSLTLGSYLVVALTMGILIKEEDSGTAHWILSKPMSRVAYVLAKFTAAVALLIPGAVLIPGVAFFGLVELVYADGVRDWAAAFSGIGFVALNAVVVVGLVIGLSALFNSTAMVAGIAVALNFIPVFLRAMVDPKIVGFFPITMGETALRVAEGDGVYPLQPVVSGAVVALLGVTFACVRLTRRQFN